MDKLATGYLELRPHHCGISVPNLEASIAWYRDMLGFSVEIRGTNEKAHAEVAFIKHGDFCIELFEVAGAAPMPQSRRHPDTDIVTHGTKHIAFEVQDIRRLMDTLKQRDVDVVWERPLSAYIRDNSGVLLEFVQKGWKPSIVQQS